MIPKKKVKFRYKPSYSLRVRRGLASLLRKTVPSDAEEMAAADWVAAMQRWHDEVFKPDRRRR